MDITNNETGNCKNEMVATLTYEELKPYFEKEILDFKKNANIPGFRKGKAPLDMIKKIYNDTIEYSSLEKIADEVFKKYCTENDINIYGAPELLDMDYKPKESLMIKISYEYIPKLADINYKNLEVTKNILKPNPNQVETEYIELLNQNAELVMDGQVLDENYLVTIDVQNLDENGNIIIGETDKDLKIYLNNPNLMQSIKEVLKDIREGETKIWEFTAGEKTQKSQITCTKIEKLVFPELNNESLKKITGKTNLNSAEDLKEQFKRDIESYYENQTRKTLEDNLIREIIRNNDVKVPDGLVNTLLKQNYNEYLEKHKSHHHNEGELETEKEYFAHQKSDTILYLKWAMIKERIIEIEKFELNDEDIRAFSERPAAEYGIEIDRLIDIYKNNEQAKSMIIDKKLFDFLIENSKITEKIVNEPTEDEGNEILSEEENKLII